MPPCPAHPTPAVAPRPAHAGTHGRARCTHVLSCTSTGPRVPVPVTHAPGTAMSWQVPGDAHCHHPGDEDEEGPGLPWPYVPRAWPPIPDQLLCSLAFPWPQQSHPQGPNGIVLGGSRGGGSRGQLLPSPTGSAPTAASSCAGPRLPPCSLISVIGGGDPAAPFRCSRPVDVAVERRAGGTARRGHGSPTRHPTGLIPAQLPQSLTRLGKGVVR